MRLRGDAPSRSGGPAPTKPDVGVRSSSRQTPVSGPNKVTPVGPIKPDIAAPRVDPVTRKVQ